MKNRIASLCLSTAFATGLLVFGGEAAYATSILISGNSMDEGNTGLTGTIAGLGLTATFVAPANLASTSLAGYDAVWLDGFSLYGAGPWGNSLMAFMQGGGNVFVQNPGFGSEGFSSYPLGAQLSAAFTYPPGTDTINIVDGLSPAGANHPANAGLTNGGLSQWGPSAYGYFTAIGSFTGLTNNGTPGQWITIMNAVGAGYLVYTQQGVSQYLGSPANPGANSDAARFLNNVATLENAVPEPPTLLAFLLGLGIFARFNNRNRAQAAAASTLGL